MLDMSINVFIVEEKNSYAQYLREQFTKNKEINIADIFTHSSYLFSYLTQETCLPDVVLMDFELPGTDSLKATYQIKMRNKDTQVVMLAEDYSQKDIITAIKAGVVGFVLKSEPFARIEEAVVDAYKGLSYISSPLARKLIDIVKEYPLKTHEGTYFEQLSPRESEITDLLAQGLSTRDISNQLFISYETLRTHIRSIFEKVHVNSRAELMALYDKITE